MEAPQTKQVRNISISRLFTTCRSPHGLKDAGYPNPSTDTPISRSMSGSQYPNILPSTTYYEEVRNIGREFVARQSRRFSRPRRERKMNYRHTVLPSNASAGSSQAEDVNSSIDSFTAVSAPSYDAGSYMTSMHYPPVSRYVQCSPRWTQPSPK